MVKIRLRRVGAKKQPSFRVVVADSRAPRDGRFIEVIGFYNPRTEPETLEIKEDRALYWLNVGAQPTESVIRLLTTHGTLARFERLKQGELLEALVAEAEEAAQTVPEVSPKTRHELAQAVVEEPAAESGAEEAEEEQPEAEVEAEVATEAEVEVQAETEGEEEAELAEAEA